MRRAAGAAGADPERRDGVGQRRTALLKTFNANPAPAVICRLSDLRYVKVNQGFLDMTGYQREQVMGRSVYELDVLEQAEHKELAIQRLGKAQPFRKWRPS